MYPLDNIKVTFELSFSAAKQLRDLAVSGDDRLRDLGIVKVKINNGSEISLLDRDNFKKPVLPLFTSRKELKGSVRNGGKVRTPPGSRGANSQKQTRAKQPQKTKPCSGGDAGFEPSQDMTCSDLQVGVVGESLPFANSFTEKKRVVLISQGTATEELKRLVADPTKTLSPSSQDAFHSPPKVPRLDRMCPNSSGDAINTTIDVSSIQTYSDATNSSAKTTLKTGTESRCGTGALVVTECQSNVFSHSIASTGGSTREEHTTLSEEPHIRSASGELDCATASQCNISVLTTANKPIQFVPSEGCESITTPSFISPPSDKLSPADVIHPDKHTIPEIQYYQSHTKNPDISTKNFEALQMLSDICVFETNLASQPIKETPSTNNSAGNTLFSKGTQTVDDMSKIIPQNVKLQFIDECSITTKVCDMGTAFKLAATKCGPLSRKSITPPVLSSTSDCQITNGKHFCASAEKQLLKNVAEDDECGCLTGNYHLCFRSRRPRRHSFTSSSCHVMTLRSRDESDYFSSDSDERTEGKEGCVRSSRQLEEDSSNSSIDQMESRNSLSTFEVDCNNNDSTMVNIAPKLFGNSNISGLKANAQGMKYASPDHSSCSQLSPLAMLKGTVNRIPSPDVPCHERLESSPKNIVDEYTEIIEARLEDDDSHNDDMMTCTDALDRSPTFGKVDFRNSPPPLLFREFGTRPATDIPKDSLPDTPPPLNESAVTALTCLSNRNAAKADTTFALESETFNESKGGMVHVSMQSKASTENSPSAATEGNETSTKSELDMEMKSEGETTEPETPSHSTCISAESCIIDQNSRIDEVKPVVVVSCSAEGTSGDAGTSEESKLKNAGIENESKCVVSTEGGTCLPLASKNVQKSDEDGERNDSFSGKLSTSAYGSSPTVTQGSPISEEVACKKDADSCETLDRPPLPEEIVDNSLSRPSDNVQGEIFCENSKDVILTTEDCSHRPVASPSGAKEDSGDNSEPRSEDTSQCSANEDEVIKACQPQEVTCAILEVAQSTTDASDVSRKDIECTNATESPGTEQRKPKPKKKLVDGVPVEDLSYVLKRIQGDDSDRHNSSKKMTRSQKRLSDGTLRSLKRLRSSR